MIKKFKNKVLIKNFYVKMKKINILNNQNNKYKKLI